MDTGNSSIIQRTIGALFPQSRQKVEPDLGQLTRLVRRYSVEQQQVPKELADLITNHYLENIPPAPNGKRFIIDRKKVEVKLEKDANCENPVA